jgi:hypothetical protein
VRAATYTLAFFYLTRTPLPLLISFGPHFVTDHWRISRFRPGQSLKRSTRAEQALGGMCCGGAPTGPAGLAECLIADRHRKRPARALQRPRTDFLLTSVG